MKASEVLIALDAHLNPHGFVVSDAEPTITIDEPGSGTIREIVVMRIVLSTREPIVRDNLELLLTLMTEFSVDGWVKGDDYPSDTFDFSVPFESVAS